MNVFSSSPSKYSAIALPLIALGLAQLINGYNQNWREHFQPESDVPPMKDLDGYYEYYKSYYDNLHKEAAGRSLRNSKNATKRDYTPQADQTKTLSLPQMPEVSLPKPTVVAYRRTLHNVSWAVTIPLFTFLLPIAGSGDPVSLENQALYGFFSALIVIIGFAVPNLFNGAIPSESPDVALGQSGQSRSRKAALNHLMHPGHLMNLVGLNLENQIGIDAVQCMQKTVCEAYRSPQNEKYGMLVWPIKYFFPAKNVSDNAAKSIYEIAARDGKFSDTKCGKKYDCMFDVLDLASYFLSVYRRARKEEKEKQGLTLDENDLQNI